MTMRMIQDYFKAFRWKKIVESYKQGGWWIFIYWLFVWPAIFHLYELAEDALTFFMIGLPIVFAMFAAPLHSLTLPKLMYLCPMSRQERRSYIVRASYIRMLCPSILGLLGIVVLMLTGLCDVLCAVGILLNCVSFSVLLGTEVSKCGYGCINEKGQRTLDMESRRGITEGILMILGFGMGLFYFCILRWETSVGLAVKWLALGITLLVQLPVTIRYMKYWKEAVEYAEWYEGSLKANKR